MADKQLRHPGAVPSWANDEDFVAPAKPWDATPTKVEPGAGKRNTGYLPEDNPTAQELNFKINELGKWTQYFSSIQMMNWFLSVPRDIGAAQLNSTECVVFDEGAFAWIVAGRSDEVSDVAALAISENTAATSLGAGWQETGPTGDAKTWTWAASKRPDMSPTHTGVNTVLSHSGPSATCNVVELLSGGWSVYSVPGTGTTGINQHEYSEPDSRWVFVGVSNAAVTPVPAIWTQTTPIGGALTPRAAAAVNSTECVCVAVKSSGSPLIVVAGDAAPFDVWTATDGFTFTRATPTGITGGEEARALMWDDVRQVFVLLTDKGCYTSVDGVAYVSLVTYLTDFAYRCLAYDGGGIYVACNDSASPIAARYSVDGGITWRVRTLPIIDTLTTAPRQVAYSRYNGQFAIALEDNPFQGALAFSLGVGEALFDPDSVLQIPTVP